LTTENIILIEEKVKLTR